MSLAAALLGVVFDPSVAHADPATITPEQAYDLGQTPHPRALAVGGAANAVGTSTTSLFYNPANLPLARVYHFEALAAVSPEARRQTYGGAIVDSMTNRLAGGVGGSWSILDPDGQRRSWTDIRLGLGLPLGERVSIGIGGRYLRLDNAVSRGPLGASLASDGTREDPVLNALTFDAGLTILPFGGLRLAAVGHNLTNPGTALAPTTVTGAIGWKSDDFSIEGDVLVDFTTWKGSKIRAMGGGEYLIADHFPLRAGYRYDDGMGTHAISAGVGYVDRRFSVELSGSRDIVATHPGTLISLGLRYFYDSGKAPTDEPEAF